MIEAEKIRLLLQVQLKLEYALCPLLVKALLMRRNNQHDSMQNIAAKNRTASSRKQLRLTAQALSTCRQGRPHEMRVAYSGAMSAEQSMILQVKAISTSVLVMKRISGVRKRPLHRKLNEISIQTGRFLSVSGTVRKPSHGGTQSASSIRIPAWE